MSHLQAGAQVRRVPANDRRGAKRSESVKTISKSSGLIKTDKPPEQPHRASGVPAAFVAVGGRAQVSRKANVSSE
jgi:hypothetical protein